MGYVMSVLAGKVSIVTGSSKGIGAGIALAFGQAGASVVVNYVADRDGAARVQSRITESGGRAIVVQADMSKPSDIQRLFDDTRSEFGHLDVLVNNAAAFAFDPLERVTEEQFHWHFNTNVLGPLLACQEALKLFSPAGANIINIGSLATRSPFPNSVLFSATKGALDAATRVLAQELGSKGIRVNSINPGSIDTEGSRRIGVAGGAMEQVIIDRTPLGRFGRPSDIGELAVFLASDAASFITGELIHASGGL